MVGLVFVSIRIRHRKETRGTMWWFGSQYSQLSTLCCIREIIWLTGKALAFRTFLRAILFSHLWRIQNYVHIGNTRLRRVSDLAIRRRSLVLVIIVIFSVILTSGAISKEPVYEFRRSHTMTGHDTDIRVGHNACCLCIYVQQKWDCSAYPRVLLPCSSILWSRFYR
jgi:hypothetical protein